jgi:hypothetical protein
MTSHLEHDFDVADAFSKLGELAENPLHLADLGEASEDVEAFASFSDRVDCGDLEIDVECQGARLA